MEVREECAKILETIFKTHGDKITGDVITDQLGTRYNLLIHLPLEEVIELTEETSLDDLHRTLYYLNYPLSFIVDWLHNSKVQDYGVEFGLDLYAHENFEMNVSIPAINYTFTLTDLEVTDHEKIAKMKETVLEWMNT